MAKLIRSSLATVCFGLSVSSLALWLQSEVQWATFLLDVENGEAIFEVRTDTAAVDYYEALRFGEVWRESHSAKDKTRFEARSDYGLFARFPLWYPSLVFALAGVGVLRFRRQFSIRSAMICVSVVALLLGIVAAL